MYTVSVEVDADGQRLSAVESDFVVVVADTMVADSIVGSPGETVTVTISTYNTVPVSHIKVPVEYSGDFMLTPQSYSVVGCRTEYFDDVSFSHYDGYNRRFTMGLDCGLQEPLPPGEGPILEIAFRISSSAGDGQSCPIEIDGYEEFLPRYYGDVRSYPVASRAGVIQVEAGCCTPPLRGNVNDDPEDLLNIVDLTYLVAHLFGDGAEPPCFEEADVTGDGDLNIEDLTCIVAYLFDDMACTPVPCP
jgi:hypothetical protein